MPSREGSPNKNKLFLMKRLQDMYGEDFHPIMKMAQNCVTLQKIAYEHKDGGVSVGDSGVVDASVAAKNANDAWEKVAQYVEPKLKATEFTGNNGNPIEHDHLWQVEFLNAEDPDQS